MRGRILATILIMTFPLLALSQTDKKDLHSRSKKAIALFEQAKALDHAGNWYRSLDLLKQALAKDNSFDEAILLTHQVLIKRGFRRQADSVWIRVRRVRIDVSRGRKGDPLLYLLLGFGNPPLTRRRHVHRGRTLGNQGNWRIRIG